MTPYNIIKTHFIRSTDINRLEEQLNTYLEENHIHSSLIIKIYYTAILDKIDIYTNIINTVMIVYEDPPKTL